MEKQLSNINIIAIAAKWRLHLIIIFILSIVLSVIFSGPKFIEPKYKSYAIIYPSNLIPYSSETATEQMLQLFKSDDLRDSIIVKFDLVNYYKINTNKKYYYSTLIKAYNENVTIKKTEFESVLVEVLDRNPNQACNIVKEMINIFNRKVEDGILYPNEDDYKLARELMIENINNKVSILKSKMFIKQIKNSSDLKAVLKSNISPINKKILLNLYQSK